MGCQVLFTFLKRVGYKWMPYLVVFYFLLNVSGSMRLFLPPGGSIVLRQDFYLLKSFVQRGGCSGLGLITLEK